MPKYVLDERGILTITSEHDGGIFTVRDILKKVSLIVFVVSFISCIGLYVFFYYDVPTTEFANTYCIDRVADFTLSSQLNTVANNISIYSDFEDVTDMIGVQVKFYADSFEKICRRGVDLADDICEEINAFRDRWR